MFCQLNLISKRGPNAKMRKNAKNYQTLKIFSSLVSLTRHFTKFIFLEQLTAMPQFNMQNMLLLLLFFFSFFFFFLSSYHDTNPLRHLYYFRQKYNYILANINSVHQGSYFHFLLVFHPVGQTFLYPSEFRNHLKHSAK